MANQSLSAALAAATDTREVLLGRGVLATAGPAIRRHLGPGPHLIVADENTWSAAGAGLRASLLAAGCDLAEPLLFPADPPPYAAYATAQRVKQAISDSAATAVALGAGTINDLVKVAAFELGQGYAVVGTAASMDGYTGAGAPMSADGVKVTRSCRAPVVAVMDLDVIAAAPARLTASGYGDLAAKIPGGADWILADVTGVEPMHDQVWQLVQGGVSEALAQPDALAAGDPEAFAGLAAGLCLSGLGMQAYGGTRPASGAEHYFSHLWELEHLGEDIGLPSSHGHKVGIGSLAMCGFYEALLSRDLTTVDLDRVGRSRASWGEIEADIRATFTGALADHAVAETKAKYAAGRELIDRLAPLVANWPEVAGRLRAQLVPLAELRDMLRRVGAPSRPQDIGLSLAEVREMFPKAMYYRSRYTALDVAWELGWFDELVDEVFTDIWLA